MIKKALIALMIVSTLSIGFCAAQDSEAETIIETATDAGDFNTLVAAIETAGLTDTLNGMGPFTVFAPTDAAFEALAVDLPEDPEVLADILKYHVLADEITSTELEDGMSLVTLQGGSLTITIEYPEEEEAAEEADEVAPEEAAEEADEVAPEEAAEEADEVAPEEAAEEADEVAPEEAAEEADEVAPEEEAAEEADEVAPEEAAEEAEEVAPEEVLMVDGAKIVTADIMCSNGVIHVIDAVLIPPAEDAEIGSAEESVEEVAEPQMETESPAI